MTPRRRKPPEERAPVKLTDPRAIRALAHPARLAVIDELYTGRELTATECAEIAGLSPSAMSYHLRSLEKAGIVERAESTGDNRERPWRAAGSYLQVDSTTGGAGELAASSALNATVLGRTVELFDKYMGRRSAESLEWLNAVEASYGQLWLTPEEATEIGAQFLAVVEKYRGRKADTAKRPPRARRMRLAVLLFPSDPPEASSDGT